MAPAARGLREGAAAGGMTQLQTRDRGARPPDHSHHTAAVLRRCSRRDHRLAAPRPPDSRREHTLLPRKGTKPSKKGAVGVLEDGEGAGDLAADGGGAGGRACGAVQLRIEHGGASKWVQVPGVLRATAACSMGKVRRRALQ